MDHTGHLCTCAVQCRSILKVMYPQMTKFLNGLNSTSLHFYPAINEFTTDAEEKGACVVKWVSVYRITNFLK